ncbi:hypothetical protein IAD21_00836 [Abditibacteriota bacterium]|nr:hypothetical protein IAD21_00836 [Abditibacteriota bacterium]
MLSATLCNACSQYLVDKMLFYSIAPMKKLTNVLVLVLVCGLLTAPTWISTTGNATALAAQEPDPVAPAAPETPNPMADPAGPAEVDAAPDEWKALAPDKWATLEGVDFKLGFAKDWTVSGDKIISAVSPDGLVSVQVYTPDEKTPTDVIAKLNEETTTWLKGLTLDDPQETRECNGLSVLMTGGIGKNIADTQIDVGVDIVTAPDGKMVVVLMTGMHDAMVNNASDVILTQQSYQKAN